MISISDRTPPHYNNNNHHHHHHHRNPVVTAVTSNSTGHADDIVECIRFDATSTESSSLHNDSICSLKSNIRRKTPASGSNHLINHHPETVQSHQSQSSPPTKNSTQSTQLSLLQQQFFSSSSSRHLHSVPHISLKTRREHFNMMAPPSNNLFSEESPAAGTATGTATGGATGGQSMGPSSVPSTSTSSSSSARGQATWLHQDNEILGQGVCYTVKVSLIRIIIIIIIISIICLHDKMTKMKRVFDFCLI